MMDKAESKKVIENAKKEKKILPKVWFLRFVSKKL